MKNPLTLAGIEPATFRFVVQHLNHCATAVPKVCDTDLKKEDLFCPSLPRSLTSQISKLRPSTVHGLGETMLRYRLMVKGAHRLFAEQTNEIKKFHIKDAFLTRLQSHSYSKNFPNFQEVDGSSPCSPQPIASTLSESSEYSPDIQTALLRLTFWRRNNFFCYFSTPCI